MAAGAQPPRALAKFEPPNGQCYVFVGQDLGAVGGMEGYTNGYCDAGFPMPAGVTVYLGLQPADVRIHSLYSMKNYGAGDCAANFYATAPRFANVMIAVGMPMVRQEAAIVAGRLDNSLGQLADWFKSLGARPVFLRAGYEFDGTAWNHYTPQTYVPAFRYVHDYMTRHGVTNVAYVWQSSGSGLKLEDHDAWYPGDAYVDWCGYSHFAAPSDDMIRFARARGKPVFIAEATPLLHKDGKILDCDIKKPEVAHALWEKWFTHFFRTIEDNPGTVKAFSYINADWASQPLWKKDATFGTCDSRVQCNPFITTNWLRAVSAPRFSAH
jgi:hypothetical protein